MSAPHTGQGIVSVLAGVLLAGTAFSAPAVATDHQAATGPVSLTAQTDRASAAVVFRGRVIAHPSLNVRKTPNTNHKPIRSIPFGTVIDIKCKVNGQVVDGNPRWYLLKKGGWVAARYVENINGIPPWC
ncbi:SH3 domain-containing protein [Streptomyces sp. NPDC050433]|uniref:SH3 domain-containing protein n=1 Tax=unclassified Streptomyces TaxID=2593676 RepID=UPI00342CEA78